MKQPKLSLKKDKFNPVFITRDLLKSNDAIKKELSNYSLNELLRTYSKNIRLESLSSNLIANLALETIEDGHVIPLEVYKDYADNFWKGRVQKTMVMDRAQVVNMLKSATVLDYIMFDFTDLEIADFKPSIVRKHVFKTNVSCFPAVIFMKMLQDADFNKLEITKGIKIFSPPSKYVGPYTIAMLIYTDAKKVIQYIDIVDDPTIDMKGYIQN